MKRTAVWGFYTIEAPAFFASVASFAWMCGVKNRD